MAVLRRDLVVGGDQGAGAVDLDQVGPWRGKEVMVVDWDGSRAAVEMVKKDQEK